MISLLTPQSLARSAEDVKPYFCQGQRPISILQTVAVATASEMQAMSGYPLPIRIAAEMIATCKSNESISASYAESLAQAREKVEHSLDFLAGLPIT